MPQKWRDLIVPNETEENEVEDTTPLEVTIKETKKEISIYDSIDNEGHDDTTITDKEIEEFENGKDT